MDKEDHSDCEERLGWTQEALVRSQQLAIAGQFAGGIMHDVNNPLEAIGNLVYLAKQTSTGPEEAQLYLSMAEEQLAHVQQIARRTLSFYREHAPSEPIDVIEILDCALHIHMGPLALKSIGVYRRHPKSVKLQGNPGELLQVFANLIGNSIEALPEQGVLHVRVSRQRGQFHILIADNGCGIPEGQQEQLFEPFVTSKGEKGTGLGLWMSKTLVDRHHGRIRHRSSTRTGRRGTAFRISLPG